MASKKVGPELIGKLRSLVETIVTSIVDSPDEVEVNIVPASYRLLVELHTSPNDVGQVIGKGGHVVDSIRSIVCAFGGRERVRVDFDFVTEQEKTKRFA